MSNPILAYHFTAETLRDGRPIPPVGEWLEHEGEVVMCESGLHASRDPFDALRYAPGPLLHRVECDGIVEECDDKLVCRHRRILATVDMEAHLRLFACHCVRKTPIGDGRTVWDLLTDERSRKAVEVSERFARGEATREELRDARTAAQSAYPDSAYAAAYHAAAYASYDSAYAAAFAAYASYDSAYAAAQAWQRREFNQLVSDLFNQGEK